MIYYALDANAFTLMLMLWMLMLMLWMLLCFGC